MDVDAVGNDRGECAAWRESGGDDAGIAMIHRAHRIEEVGEHPRAGGDAGVCFVEGGVGVTDRNDHAACGEAHRRFDRAG